MKRLVPILLSVLLATSSYGQANYNFSYFTATYANLSNDTTLFPVGFFDTLALGFNITIDGKTNDSLRLRSKGTISADNITTIYERTFEPFGGEHSQGQYSYAVQGAAGSRIVKIQYKNARFDHDMTSNDFINFQVWLYEADNAVEIHYGPSNIQNPTWDYYYGESGPYVGFKGFSLTGNATAPHSDTGATVRVTGTPPNGMVYRFAPVPNSVSTLVKEKALSVYPNPATNTLLLSREITTACYIYDMTGKQMMQVNNTKQIDISKFPAGSYFLKAGYDHCHFTKL